MKINELQAKTKPSLRFSHYSEEWSRKEFSELFSIKRTNSYSRDDLNYLEGSVKNIHYGDIHTRFNSRFDISTEVVPFLNSEIDTTKIENDDYCKIGDVIMADASEDFADVGKAIEVVNLKEEKVVAGLHTLLIRPKDETFTAGFLAYLFQSWKIRLQIMTYAQGAKVLGISRGWLNRIFLDFPSSGEQRKIETFLSAVDDKIGQLSSKKEMLTRYKKGVMQQIFDQKIRFKDDNGAAFPDWEERKLGEVATLSKGKGVSKDDVSENGKLECIRYGELYTHYAETINEVISRTNIDKSNLVLSKPNDVIIPASGETNLDIAKASCVLREGIALGGDLNIIRTKLNGVFLSYYLNNKKKHGIARLAQGVSVVHLYPSQLVSLKLDIPSPAEQKKIADFLAAIDSKIDLVNIQLEKTKTFKKGLLQRMFV